MSATTKTVGEFTYDPTDGTVRGPAEYMASADYERCIASITDGTSHTFASAIAHAPDTVTALLVTIQTSYAGWHGMQGIHRMLGRG